ncbi:MAG TPA: diguanylate cyclase response regulator [Eubacteriaceae bacterium]|nr:diguanylate cyclase response regulator [Eubacteriaceae bacterium]
MEEKGMLPEQTQSQQVLVVEDTAIFLTIIKDILKGVCEVVPARNAREALDLLEAGTPVDLILMDVVLPDMNGYDLVKAIKSNEATKDISVIFITSLSGEQDEEYGLSIGAIDYITKPFSKSIVRARVKNHLELKRYRDVLKNMSMIDGLTELNNRRRFEEYVGREWNRCLRNQKPLAILLIDIDYFKKYNDYYGHLEGDEALKTVAKVIEDSLKRSGDFVARWGGEEFACVLAETDKEGAIVVAERLRQAVCDLQIDASAIEDAQYVTVSIGIAAKVPEKKDNWEALLKEADHKLYEAKDDGRNKVIY